MTTCVILNGTSSAGKSSLAKAFINSQKDLWLYFSIDDLLDRWIGEHFCVIDNKPYEEWQKDWFFHHASNTEGTMRVFAADGQRAKKLRQDLIHAHAQLFAKGYNLLFDEVLLHSFELQCYRKAFEGSLPDVHLVNVVCDEQERLRREQGRGDRWPGLSAGYMQTYELVDHCDLELNTTQVFPEAAAEHLEEYLTRHCGAQALGFY